MAENELESTVEASLFEGLFQRALRPDLPFIEELKTVGFDLRNLKPRYPTRVWRESLEIARRRVYPSLPVEEGYRALGRRFSEGFFETIIGRFISVAFPMIGPAGMLKMAPRNVRAGRRDVDVVPVQEGERRWRITFKDRTPSPDFIAGLVESTGRRTGVHMVVTVENRSPEGYDLVATW
jgi:uncharacterized protein (TIGR02265 family)